MNDKILVHTSRAFSKNCVLKSNGRWRCWLCGGVVHEDGVHIFKDKAEAYGSSRFNKKQWVGGKNRKK